MIHGRKIAALCVAEIQNEDIQSMMYPLYNMLEQNGWKTFIFSSCTSMYFDVPFDRGEAGIFRLVPYDLVDVVVIYARTLKKTSIIDDIIGWSRQYDKPVIVIDDDERRPGAVHVNFDESDAFRNLIKHLLEHHHVRKINCISGIPGNEISEKRTAIYKEELEAHGIPFEEKRLGYGMFWGDPTYKVMNEFFKDPDGLPEAIVCLNDTMAILACEVLEERGIRVPEEMIVTGFDGIVQEKYNVPRISTCRRDMDQFGGFVYNIIEEHCGGKKDTKQYYFPYVFDASESCGCTRVSVLDVNIRISDMYKRMDNSISYDRSMTEMLARVVKLENPQDILKGIKEYVQEDVWLCFNTDFASLEQLSLEERTPHRYDTQPFTDTVITDRFFVGRDRIRRKRIWYQDLIPDWKEAGQRKQPLIFYTLHNQEEICGYAAAFVKADKYIHFGNSLQRIQKLMLNLNNAVSMYTSQTVLRATNRKLMDIQSEIIARFADLVEARDDSTGQHVKRTGEYFRILGRHLAKHSRYAKALNEQELELMCKAAPLHDIGKIKISDLILNKPGRLTPEEFEIIKTHTVEGSKIIASTMANIEEERYLKVAGDIALYHHEKWDGSGYPHRLAGEEIPLCARIMAVVDVFDALTSKRVYKDAYSLEKAYDILKESSGTHFDPEIVKVFMDNHKEIEQVFFENTETE